MQLTLTPSRPLPLPPHNHRPTASRQLLSRHPACVLVGNHKRKSRSTSGMTLLLRMIVHDAIIFLARLSSRTLLRITTSLSFTGHGMSYFWNNTSPSPLPPRLEKAGVGSSSASTRNRTQSNVEVVFRNAVYSRPMCSSTVVSPRRANELLPCTREEKVRNPRLSSTSCERDKGRERRRRGRVDENTQQNEQNNTLADGKTRALSDAVLL